MTRRVVKPKPVEDPVAPDRLLKWKNASMTKDGAFTKYSPYGQSGDRLWVRETWKPTGFFSFLKTMQTRACGRFAYAADENQLSRDSAVKWRPSIFMPRWASRITLEVTGVKVERVQDISEEDAESEGVEIDCSVTNRNDGLSQYRDYSRPHGCTVQSAVQSFHTLWDSINSKRGYGWDANPWVWCVSFRVVK